MRCEYHDLIRDMLGDNQPPAPPEPQAEPYIVGLRPATRPAAPSPAVPPAERGDESSQRAVKRLDLDLQKIESLLPELLSLRAAPPAKSTQERQAR
jgi:hypothetical protein